MEKLLLSLVPMAYAVLLFVAFLVLIFKFKDGSISVKGLGLEITLTRKGDNHGLGKQDSSKSA